MLWLLAVEYILGMYAAMFIELPKGVAEKDIWSFAWKQFPIALHIIIGLLLVIGSITLLIMAIRKKEKPWIWATVLGTVGVFGAFGAGSAFVSSGAESYSFIMAISFLIAFAGYGWGLYKNR